MTFDSFVADPFPNTALEVIGAFATVGVLLGLSLGAFFVQEKWLKVALALLAMVGLTVTVLGVNDMQTIADDVKAQNRVIGENNLKKKYDIESVLWGEMNTYPESYDVTEIVVQDKNDNILKFRYKLNSETREPSLLNDSDHAQIKSNDLLLTKTS